MQIRTAEKSARQLHREWLGPVEGRISGFYRAGGMVAGRLRDIPGDQGYARRQGVDEVGSLSARPRRQRVALFSRKPRDRDQRAEILPIPLFQAVARPRPVR